MVAFRSFTVQSNSFRVDGMQSNTIPPTDRTTQKVLKTLRKRTFCTIATFSPAGHAHSAGVVYAFTDDALWVHTLRTSRKARNLAGSGRIGVCIPFRRLPVGPPYTIHFQALADVFAMDDPDVIGLVATGKLKGITGHGELDMPDGCFLHIRPTGTVPSFGPGARVLDLIRDPLNNGTRSFDFAEAI